MRNFRRFTSKQNKVSKNEVVEKVIPAADFWMFADDVPKIKEIGGCVLKLYSQSNLGHFWDTVYMFFRPFYSNWTYCVHEILVTECDQRCMYTSSTLLRDGK